MLISVMQHCFVMVKGQQGGQPCSSGKKSRRYGEGKSESKHESH